MTSGKPAARARLLRPLCGLALLGWLASPLGCAAQESRSPAPLVGSSLGRSRLPRTDACPLTLDGVRADIETTGRGAAINLSASPDQLMLLRARVADAATTPGGVLAACPCGSSPAGTSPPAADVNVEDFEGGTRLVVTARDPSDARTLASLVRTQLARVHGGDCPGP